MFDPNDFDAAAFDVAEFIASRKTCKARPAQINSARSLRATYSRPANVSRGTR